MSSYLKKEEEKVEERINSFTEQQHAALQVLETRIRQERNTLLMYALINLFKEEMVVIIIFFYKVVG